MQRYNPKDIEPKWQKTWDKEKTYTASDESSKPKKYVLEYFPYPSGSAMHVGHVRNYTIGDVMARYYRMRGYNVLHPMGWDAFGLPAENYAIKNNISPKQAIAENTTKFKQQLTQMGFSYDWSREINSSDPEYYRWTQWIFNLLFKKELAYQKESLQWWCETDKTVLANEQVESGKCWRCGNEVTKKSLKQWFFKITDYADRLVADLDDLDWSESIKSMQRNWVGKSKGAEIEFKVAAHEGTAKSIRVFTTRPDTLFGATFLVLAPEHELVSKLTVESQESEVESYIKTSQAKSDIERQEVNREKTGVFTGSYAVNPANNTKIPIWVADYVLMGYGTGAIMAVPAHDDRDHEFATKHSLEIIEVIQKPKDTVGCYTGEGLMINSDKYNGLTTDETREKIVAELSKKKLGKEKINYKIRDWLISRQRYWGAPIPIIHCSKDGAVPVPDDQLPVVLPDVKSYQPTGEGTSVLASVEDWVNTTCPKCGGPALRETDTMDGFACSSWYFLRFADPHNSKKPFNPELIEQWLPIDDYIGGAEHAVMHLLYARFWTKVLFDEGLIKFEEPFKALRNHGMILAPDGRKMSKSWNNVIAPDDLINQGYGADTVRLMELFIGPWDQSANWSIEGMGGTFRFLQRIWTLVHEYLEQAETAEGPGAKHSSDDLLKLTHKTIARVSADLQDMGFNTAIASLMDMVNQLYKLKVSSQFTPRQQWHETLNLLVQLVAPFAPHIAEELWQNLGNKSSVHSSQWPVHYPKYLIEDEVKIVIQVNGKLRGEVNIANNLDEKDLVAAASKEISTYLKETKIIKTIIVPGKLINFVVK